MDAERRVSPLLSAALSVGAIALLAVLVGRAVDPWLAGVVAFIGLGAQLIYHLVNFQRLERWSRNPAPAADLVGNGVWDTVFARLYRHEKQLHADIAQRGRDLAGFAAAVQALTDGIALLDENQRIVWCNVTAEAQLGIALASDRGQPIANLVRQPEFVNYLTQADYAQPLILHFDQRGGNVLSIALLAYGNGNFLMQVKDVTQADRLDRMRRDFVANVSHELRTPLTVLAGFLETLQEIAPTAEERERYLQLMREQSDRMQSIVRDLLTLSALEAAPPPENEAIDMASLLDKLQRDARMLSRGRHLIVLEADRGDLRGAESELASAFGNLVSNAVRYTPEGGRVTIRWQTRDQPNAGGEFSVTDSGIGIDPKHIPRLTERFYRIDRGRSRDTGGTGLGLAIVKHALNRHQSTLEIASEPGKGSRFAARFPAARIVRD